MAAFSFVKTLFVASLLVLVISSDATRPIDQAMSTDSSSSIMKKVPVPAPPPKNTPAPPSQGVPSPPHYADPHVPPPEAQGSPCMKHKLMTENLCNDICSTAGYQTHHFISFNAVDSDSICCCCAAGSNCNIPPSWA